MALIERIGRAFSSLSPQSTCRTFPTVSAWPENVGILALDVYFPSTKVDQADLEIHDGVSKGKYTVGLGQTAMAFAGDNEDVVSMAMTVVSQLLQKYAVEPRDIGRLEVGTESSIDRSKSIKSNLMRLFKDQNTDIQGVDCVSACYGATAALFNAVNWVESRSWDGRYALVVASDLATYASGPARPSGGCGAVAMLIGPNAPLVVETEGSATFMEHTYDFYKPSGIYPQVDGKLSMECYLRALDECYRAFLSKQRRNSNIGSREPTQSNSLEDFDFCVMHVPFGKMVRKGFSQLMLSHASARRENSDALPPLGNQEGVAALPSVGQDSAREAEAESSGTQEARESSKGASGSGRSLNGGGLLGIGAIQAELMSGSSLNASTRAVVEASEADFERMARPGLLLSSECGNMYTASLYASIASLLHTQAEKLVGCRILAYSYGSGLAASMYGIKVRDCEGEFALANIVKQLDLERRLSRRRTVSPEQYMETLSKIEQQYGSAGFQTGSPPAALQPGTFYLASVSDSFQRSYERVL